jgi:hypothetical protein
VETVAGGQLPPDQEARLQAELAATVGEPWCGFACCNVGDMAMGSASGIKPWK